MGTGEEERQRAGGRESGQEEAREYLIEGGAADSLSEVVSAGGSGLTRGCVRVYLFA